MYIIIVLLLLSFSFSQSKFNPNETKFLINEWQSFQIDKTKSLNQSPFNITYNLYYYYNSNLPNLENQNGIYIAKGLGTISGVLLEYSSKHLTFSTEPTISKRSVLPILLPEKKETFSVLNDVPLNRLYLNKFNKFRNTGIKLSFYGISGGYGNWDQWWGPGIHNSLVMTNNARGMPHYFLETLGYQTLFGDLQYNFKYTVSNAMLNNMGAEYFLSAYYFNLKYKNLEFGKSQHILNGGYQGLRWSLNDAKNIFFTNNNMKYWDSIIDYYISANFPSSGLIVFVELGVPLNRSYNSHNPELYHDHIISSNMGLRKYGAFGKDEFILGFEYTRLVQGIYYNILPTPNWYDNIKYNYSSYNGRRWTAHSGSDSDDFLIFIGYMADRASLIYGLNYERHGVTYHFPPEVKLESRISISYKYNNTFIYLNYENEYFEHYGFVDVNKNVWLETYEPGSIQHTQTLLFSIEHSFSF